MRKIASRRKKRKKLSIIIPIILIIIVFACATGYAFFNEKLGINGVVRLNTKNNECDISSFEGYKSFKYDISYEKYYESEEVNLHVIVKITNTGTKYVDRWRTYVTLPESAREVFAYNCKTVYEGTSNIYENYNEYYNNVIEPGQSISFDIQYIALSSDYYVKEVATYGFNSLTESMPSISEMSNCLNGNEQPSEMKKNISKPKTNYITTSNVVNQSWSDNVYDYYNTTLTLTNNTNEEITNWYAIIDVGNNGSIPGCWSATCVQNGTEVKITPPEWKTSIPANNSIQLSFQINVEHGYNFSVVSAGKNN